MPKQKAAGGGLYQQVVDTAANGGLLLDKGQLVNRVTLLPLDKITGGRINVGNAIRARALLGAGAGEKVWPALELIEYDKKFEKVMQKVFGNVWICSTLRDAKLVAYDRGIGSKTITLDGDSVDPSGVMFGGTAVRRDESTLAKLLLHRRASVELEEIQAQIAAEGAQANTYRDNKKRYCEFLAFALYSMV